MRWWAQRLPEPEWRAQERVRGPEQADKDQPERVQVQVLRELPGQELPQQVQPVRERPQQQWLRVLLQQRVVLLIQLLCRS